MKKILLTLLSIVFVAGCFGCAPIGAFLPAVTGKDDSTPPASTAAATATGDPQQSFAIPTAVVPVVPNHESLYAQYIKDTLLPQYGAASLAPRRETQTMAYGWSYGWLHEAGLLCAYIEDLDANGTPELITLRAQARSDKGTMADNAYYTPVDGVVDIYSLEEGQIRRVSSFSLLMDSTCQHTRLALKCHPQDGYSEIILTNAYFTGAADGEARRYFIFEDGYITKECAIENRYGGSDQDDYYYVETHYEPYTTGVDGLVVEEDQLYYSSFTQGSGGKFTSYEDAMEWVGREKMHGLSESLTVLSPESQLGYEVKTRMAVLEGWTMLFEIKAFSSSLSGGKPNTVTAEFTDHTGTDLLGNRLS